MKIVKPYATILAIGSNRVSVGGREAAGVPALKEAAGVVALKHIEWCARISHRSEDAQGPESYKKILQHVVVDHGDWSVVEHVVVTVDALVDRGITHEWVRHRLFSYTQESTRFVNYEKKMLPSFIYPKPDVECEYCLSGRTEFLHGCPYEQSWILAIGQAENAYRILVTPIDKGGRGWRPQEARSVFPNALASRIITTGNLRNWRHFFIMRTTAEAHPQMKQVTIPLLAEFKSTFPILFDDIEPNRKQSESMARVR